MCWLPLVNNFRNNLGGWSSWLDSRSQGARTGLDWVCSLVRVLLLALWKEFPGPALYPFMGPPGVNSDWFLVESLEKTLWETKKKKKKKTLETFFFFFLVVWLEWKIIIIIFLVDAGALMVKMVALKVVMVI